MRNRARSRLDFRRSLVSGLPSYARKLGPLANNWAHERRLHFRYYSGENSVEQWIVLHM